MTDGHHTRGGSTPAGASAGNEQARTTTMLSIYTCSFPDECDSAPPAYPFLNRSFLMAGGKKSRAGDAVGRRAERAGVPEWLLLIHLFSKKVRANHGNTAPHKKTPTLLVFFYVVPPRKCLAALPHRNRSPFRYL